MVNRITLILAIFVTLLSVLVLSGYTSFNSFYFCTSADKSGCWNQLEIPANPQDKVAQSKAHLVEYFRRLSHIPVYVEKTIGTSPVVFGAKNLKAFGAEEQVFSVRKDGDKMFVKNLSQSASVPINIAGVTHYPRQHFLKSSDSMTIDNVQLKWFQSGLEEGDLFVSDGKYQNHYRIENTQIIGYRILENSDELTFSSLNFRELTKLPITAFRQPDACRSSVSDYLPFSNDKTINIGGYGFCSNQVPAQNIAKNSFWFKHIDGVGIEFKANKYKPYMYNRHAVVVVSDNFSKRLKHNELELTQFLKGRNRFTLDVGYTDYLVSISDSQLKFQILRNSIKEPVTNTENLDLSKVRPLVDFGVPGLIAGVMLLLCWRLVSSPIIDVTFNANFYDINFYSIVRNACQSFWLPAWRFLLVWILAVFTPLFLYVLWGISSVAIFCMFAMGLLIWEIRNTKHQFTFYLVCSLLVLILVGIEYGLGLSFSPNRFSGTVPETEAWYSMSKYFADFSRQLMVITVLLTLWLFAVLTRLQLSVAYEPYQPVTIRWQALSFLLVPNCIALPICRWKLFRWMGQVKPFCWFKLVGECERPAENGLLFGMALHGLFWFFVVSVQAVAGTETGIAGLFQPNEFVKLLLCFATAITIFPLANRVTDTIRNEIQNNNNQLTLAIVFHYIRVRFSSTMLHACIVAVGVILLVWVNHDFSYLLIIIMWATLVILYLFLVAIGFKINHSWGYLRNALNRFESDKATDDIGFYRSVMQILLRVFFVVVFTVCFYLLIRWIFLNMGLVDSYQNRIDAWQSPYANIQSSFQTKQAFDLRKDWLREIKLYAVPEIDDDFAVTGWMSSMSQLPKSTLLMATVGVLLFLILVATRSILLNGTVYRRNIPLFSQEGFIFAGLSIFLIHVMISLSNNYNLLPVMGQPYPLLGRQGSFITLFVLPFFMVVTLLPDNGEH